MENLNNNGKVIIEDGVEIMSHTHIAQAIWDYDVTRICKNTKIDAYCHIGHRVVIGEASLIANGSIIGGKLSDWK